MPMSGALGNADNTRVGLGRAALALKCLTLIPIPWPRGRGDRTMHALRTHL